MERPIRLRRSILSVPANREKMVRKALSLSADVIMLDLEDSVPVDEKEKARHAVVEALMASGWEGRVRAYRINDMGTPFAYRDLIDVVEKAGAFVDVIVVPKVNDPAEIKAIDYWLTQMEMRLGLTKKIGLEASIETAQGMLRVGEIAVSSPRLEALVFGIADYGASVGMPSGGISGHGDAEEQEAARLRWLFPLSRMAMAAKAAGLAAVDAPFGDFRDAQGLARSCAMSRALGYDGKWAIHPDQLDVINQVFTPSDDDVARSLRIVEAYEAARARGEGSVAVDGKMVDAASVRLAQVTVKVAEAARRNPNLPD